MKILVLTPLYLPSVGGAETGLFELYRRISERHEVTLITPFIKGCQGVAADIDPYYQCDRIKVRRFHRVEPQDWVEQFRFVHGLPVFSMMSAMTALKFRPDLIHANGVLPCAGALRVLRRISRAPAVMSLFVRVDILHEMNRSYVQKRAEMERALQQCRRVVYQTRYVVGDRANDPAYVQIPYGVNQTIASAEQIQSYRARMGIPPNAKVLVSLSRFDNRTKRQMLMAEAIRPLLERNKDLVLMFVGDGPDRLEACRVVREWKLAHRILMPGYIEEKDIPAALGASSIFLFASKAETFGIVLAQAMMAAIPVVAFDCTCTGEVVRHEEGGLMVADGDVEGMRQAVQRLLDNPDLQRRLGERGRQIAQSEYNWDNVAASYEKLFQDVLNEAG